MKKIDEIDLDKIKGGQIENVSGPIINALVSLIELIQQAGYSIGSGLRRVSEGNICPLK